MSRCRPSRPFHILPLLCGLCLLAALNDAAAGGGAWVKATGGYYLKTGLTSISADKEYGFKGEDRPLFRDTSRYRDASMGITNIPFYGEYGFTDWLTGTISTQFTVAVREATDIETGLSEEESAGGLGDTWVGARVNILPDGIPLVGAATLLWKIPTGSPYKDIPLGTGVADYEAALAFGTGFPVGGSTYGYLQATGGYRLRSKAADEFNWGVELGVELTETLALQTRLDGTHSTADFDRLATLPENDVAFTTLIADQSWTRLEGTVSYGLSEDMDLSFSYRRTLSGRNTLAAGALAFGIAWKWEGAESGDNYVDTPEPN